MPRSDRGKLFPPACYSSALRRSLLVVAVLAIGWVLLTADSQASAKDQDRTFLSSAAETEITPSASQTAPIPLTDDPFAPHDRPRIGPIPEPGTLLLLGTGLVTLLYRSPSKRRQSRAKAAQSA